MPPPPPPPPPGLLFGANKANDGANKGAPPDRNALLSQIRKGKPLKKVDTNDRSTPLIQGSGANKTSSSSGSGSTNCSGTNGPFIPPGGLFAHGIPKLRPTGSRTGDSPETHNAIPSRNVNRSSEIEIPSESMFNDHQSSVGMSRSQPPSPLMKARQLSGAMSNANRNFPSDLNIKGPAPVPPPANQKPKFSNQTAECDAAAKNSAANIRRSLSQTGLGSSKMIRPARPPPNIRPPPPPKTAPPSVMAIQNRPPPPPPLKPPNVKRRQSFGVADAHMMSVYNGMRFPGKTNAVPAPPPRNNSVPNSLNQVVVPNSSPTTVHVNKMTTAPPPPPSRPVSSGARPPVTRPPPPPIARSAAPPPPPPPHRSPTYPAPPSQLKATASFNAGDMTPTPPTRVSSVMGSQPTESISDFETRFFHKFQSSEYFPLPDKFTNIQKTYPSKAMLERASTRRQPPPPPPPASSHHINLSRSHSVSQTRLHIQLDARVFANNTAHC